MKGIYVLVVSVCSNIGVTVGSLGSVIFNKGFYAYVGSAQNYLEKRIERHLRKDKQRFWHIDYILCDDAVKVVEVFWKIADKSEECRIARKLFDMSIPVIDFGCSDCRCMSHLFWLGDSVDPNLKTFLTSSFACISNV